MASDDQMWQPPTIGLATAGIATPMVTANGRTAVCDPWPWPYPTHYYSPWPYAPGWSPPAPSTYTIQTLPNTEPAPLSDADVERIARRVAEMLKAAP